MKMTIIGVRVIDIPIKMMIMHHIISLKNIVKYFMIIRIKMITENLRIIIIKERANMTINIMNKINIANQNMVEKEMFINRNIKAEGMMRGTAEAREAEDIQEEVINREVVEITIEESITEGGEDMIEEAEEMKEELDPINSIIQDREM